MTKQEALLYLEKGYKLTHRFFLPGEYIYQLGEQIRDEANSILENFWKYRTSDKWEKDWQVKKN